jgi:hypothetical protein
MVDCRAEPLKFLGMMEKVLKITREIVQAMIVVTFDMLSCVRKIQYSSYNLNELITVNR